MPDLTLFQSAISSLDTAGKIVKGLLDLRTLAEVQGKVIELHTIILSAQSSALAAQSEQSALIQRIRNLEEEVARVKAWEETKKRYHLYEPRSGAFVYTLKAQSDDAEPSHWICANCYSDDRHSILQVIDDDNYFGKLLKCFKCKSEFRVKEDSEEGWRR